MRIREMIGRLGAIEAAWGDVPVLGPGSDQSPAPGPVARVAAIRHDRGDGFGPVPCAFVDAGPPGDDLEWLELPGPTVDPLVVAAEEYAWVALLSRPFGCPDHGR